MEQLITALVVITISIIVTVLKKKGYLTDDEQAPKRPMQPRPPQSRPNPQPAPSSWEDELRRLLEGNAPPAKPAPRPPPVVVQSPRSTSTSTPPPIVARPVVISAPRPVPKPAAPRVPAPAPAPWVFDATQADVELAAAKMAPMIESSRAYEQASRLDELATAQVAHVFGQHVGTTIVTRKKISPEIASIAAMFKNARTARQAVIASIILGPPRSLEQNPSNF